MKLSMCLLHYEGWHHSLNLFSVDYPKVATSLVTHDHHIEDLLVILLEFGLQISMVVNRPSTSVDELILRHAGNITDLARKIWPGYETLYCCYCDRMVRRMARTPQIGVRYKPPEWRASDLNSLIKPYCSSGKKRHTE